MIPSHSPSIEARTAGLTAHSAVRARVHAACRAVAAMRVLECLLIALSAGSLCLSAVVLSGGDPDRLDAWAAAGAAAACGAAAWWLERRSTRVEVVRSIDRAERLEGALLTVLEIESASWRSGPRRSHQRSSEIDDLLSARLTARISRWRRWSPTASFPQPIAALPLLALSVLAIAIESNPDHGITGVQEFLARDLLATTRAIQATAERLAGQGSASESRARVAAALVADAEELRDWVKRRSAPEKSLQESLARVERRISELAIAGGPSSDLDPSLSAARSRASDLREALRDPSEHGLRRLWNEPAAGLGSEGTAPPELASDPTGGVVTRLHEGSTEHGTAGGDGSASTKLAPGVAASPSDGTMSARDHEAEGRPAPELGPVHPPDLQAVGPGVEGGLSAGRWWPTRHDSVVATWVEARRKAKNSQP